MDLLPIQASAISCERVFSSGKVTIAAQYSQIKPQLMEVLQILKFSIWQDQELDFTAGYHWDNEVKDLESNIEIAEDMDTVMNFLFLFIFTFSSHGYLNILSYLI
jgi:hypothetical protein